MLKAPRTIEPDTPAKPTDRVTLDPTLHLFALLALRDAEVRAWVLAESWREALAAEPESALLQKILEADLRADEPSSINAFLVTLDVAEEAAVASLLEEKLPPNAMIIAQDCWRELERRGIRRRIDAVQSRLRGRDSPVEDQVKWQKEILDLQKRLSDIARPFSPPL
jgi:hypothetical protein